MYDFIFSVMRITYIDDLSYISEAGLWLTEVSFISSSIVDHAGLTTLIATFRLLNANYQFPVPIPLEADTVKRFVDDDTTHNDHGGQ